MHQKSDESGITKSFHSPKIVQNTAEKPCGETWACRMTDTEVEEVITETMHSDIDYTALYTLIMIHSERAKLLFQLLSLFASSVFLLAFGSCMPSTMVTLCYGS